MMSVATMLNAATRMTSVRITNITFFSTSSALNKVALRCCQSVTRRPGAAAASAGASAFTRAGSSSISSIAVAPSTLKNAAAASSGR
jgi:hypothetical protein